MSKIAMKITKEKIFVSTKGFGDLIDISELINQKISQTGSREGIASIFVLGSTAAVTVIETQAGLEEDLKEALEKIAPQNKRYRHNESQGDGNGFSHIRASLIGPSLTVPVAGGRLKLGRWQKVVIADFDNRPREREILVSVLAE